MPDTKPKPQSSPASNVPSAAQIDAQLQQALAVHQSGDLARAQVLYENLIAHQPRHFDAHHFLGVIAYQSKQYLKAVECIGKAIAIFPNNAACYSNRGLALQALQRLDAAVGDYDKAIALQPDFAEAYFNRGDALLELQRYDAAISSYDRAISLRPGLAEAYVNRGLALQLLERCDDAVVSYHSAIAIKPGYAPAHYNLGLAFASLNQHGAAVASYDKAIALKPDYAEAYHSRGNALQELQQLDDAIVSYDKAIALRPQLAAAFVGRGNACKELWRLDDALASYEAAMDLQPDNIDAKRGVFWIQLGKLNELPLIENLSLDIAAANLKEEIRIVGANKVMSDFRVLHDLEQTAHLISLGYDCEGLLAANRRYQDIYARHCKESGHVESSKLIPLTDGEVADINWFKQHPLRYQVSSDVKSCLNPENDWAAIEEQYFGSEPEIIYVDNLLSPAALREMQEFCLVSTIWKLEFKHQYLGAIAEGGFLSPLHLRLAIELREKMPRIFGEHHLEQLWAFKYTSKMGTGISVHADTARVNLNFWVTPDEANLDPQSGGLIVYDVPAPPSWLFEEYNKNDSTAIYAFLKKTGAGYRKIPYKCNRAALFNSNLFHETDKIDFKEGYANRRINVTYLFGRGQAKR